MSLGKLLRAANTKASPTRRVSVLEHLNDQIEKDAGKNFDMEDVRHNVKLLHKVVNTPTASRDKIWKYFSELYDVMNRSAVRKGGVFSPSSLFGSCERMLYYKISRTPVSNPNAGRPDARVQRIFDTGSFWHWYVQTKLFSAGVLEVAEPEVIDTNKKIYGHADGIIQINGFRALLEIKTINNRGFEQLRGPMLKHLSQASIYAKTLGLEKICFLYINKDTQDIKEYIVDMDDSSIMVAYKTIELVTKAVNKKSAPERCCKDQFTTQAIACPYRSTCFAKK